MTKIRKVNHKSFFVYAKKACPRRSLEATAIYKYFEANGFRAVSHPKKADLIFIHTCGGFDHDETFSLLSIQKAVNSNSNQVIVSGCLTKINLTKLKTFNNIHVIPPDDLEQLDLLINAKIPFSSFHRVSTVSGIHDLYHGDISFRLRSYIGLNKKFIKALYFYIEKHILPEPLNVTADPNYYKLEIAKGCLSNCSYCAIKLAMPKFRSYPQSEIIATFKDGLEAGYKNFALIAGDIGCYGFDIGTNLPKLLEELFRIDGEYKIALIDLNVRWLTNYYSDLLAILKANSKRISTIIMPVQSGSNKILKSMNRNYDIDEIKKYFLDLKNNVPGISISTHIMVGFPGETVDDFSKSVQFVKEINFEKVEIYKYEERPGTPAPNLPNKVPTVQINQRAKTLKKEIRK